MRPNRLNALFREQDTDHEWLALDGLGLFG